MEIQINKYSWFDCADQSHKIYTNTPYTLTESFHCSVSFQRYNILLLSLTTQNYNISCSNIQNTCYMSSNKKQETAAQFQRMLDISNIEQDPLDRLQAQVAKLQDQLKEVKDELTQKQRLLDNKTNEAMDQQAQVARLQDQLIAANAEITQKRKLLDIQNKTNEAMDQQLKTLRASSATREERIRTLEARLKNRPAQNGQGQHNEQFLTTKEDLQFQRTKNKNLESLNQKITEEIGSLKNQIRELKELKEQNNGRFQSSRQVDLLKLQLEQGKGTNKRLTQKASLLQSQNKELKTKLKNAETQAKTSAVSEAKVVEGPAKTVQVVSKEAEGEIKRLKAQIQDLSQQVNLQKERIKIKSEKQIQSLKAKADQAIKVQVDLKHKVAELTLEIQDLRNGIAAQSQSQMFPSRINLKSRIHESSIECENKQQKKSINDEELDEDVKIKVHMKNKGIINALNQHLRLIKQDHQILNLLSLVSTWSEEMMQRIETSINDISEGDAPK